MITDAVSALSVFRRDRKHIMLSLMDDDIITPTMREALSRIPVSAISYDDENRVALIILKSPALIAEFHFVVKRSTLVLFHFVWQQTLRTRQGEPRTPRRGNNINAYRPERGYLGKEQ